MARAGSSSQQVCNSTTKRSLELLWLRVGNESSWWSERFPRADKTRHSRVRHGRSTAASQGRDAGIAAGSAAVGWQSACKVLVWQRVNLADTVYL